MSRARTALAACAGFLLCAALGALPRHPPRGDALVALAADVLLDGRADDGFASPPVAPAPPELVGAARAQFAAAPPPQPFDAAELSALAAAAARARPPSASAERQRLKQRAALAAAATNPLMPGCSPAPADDPVASPPGDAGDPCAAAPSVRAGERPYARPLNVVAFADRGPHRLGLPALMRSAARNAASNGPPRFFLGYDGDPEELLAFLVCAGVVDAGRADAAARSVFPFVGPDIAQLPADPLVADLASIRTADGALTIRRVADIAPHFLADREASFKARIVRSASGFARIFALHLFPELGCDVFLLVDTDVVLFRDPARDAPFPGAATHLLPNGADPAHFAPVPTLARHPFPVAESTTALPASSAVGPAMRSRIESALTIATAMSGSGGTNGSDVWWEDAVNGGGISFFHGCSARRHRYPARLSALLLLQSALPAGVWPPFLSATAYATNVAATGLCVAIHPRWGTPAFGSRPRPAAMAAAVLDAAAAHFDNAGKPWDGIAPPAGGTAGDAVPDAVEEGGRRWRVSRPLDAVWRAFAGDVGVLGRCHAKHAS